jgi:hypothetical protein
MWQQVVAIDVDLVRLVTDLVARFELFDGVGIPSGGKESGQPIVMTDDFVAVHSGFDLAWPAE